jgi:hypothetical protein
LRYRLPDGKTYYEIVVRSPQGKARAVIAATCDGRRCLSKTVQRVYLSLKTAPFTRVDGD